jgi:HAD superfamily hydrolase (TIGR01549 family)
MRRSHPAPDRLTPPEERLAPLRGVFFDLDNTLIPDREAQRAALAAAWTAAFASPYPMELKALLKAGRDAYESRFGYGTPGYAELAHLSVEALNRQVIGAALTQLGLAEAKTVERLVLAYAEAQRSSLTLPVETLDTLNALRASRLKLGLITNGASAVQRAKLTSLSLADQFDLIVIDTEFGCPKPDRRIFDHAAAGVGLSPTELLFVGDNWQVDIAGARAAGWRAAWYNPREQPLPPAAPPPDHTLRCLTDLLRLPEIAAALQLEL